MGLICFLIVMIVIICLAIMLIDEKIMRCPKCKHLMRYHFNIEEDYGYWKCTKCGKEVRIYA
jgi:ribosomal protein L37AE/L43A